MARPADEGAVAELLRASYPPLLAGFYDPDLLAAALPMLVRPDPELLRCRTWFVAEASGGRLVACGGYTARRPGSDVVEPGLAHLRHFSTHPEHLRNGLASSIVDLCATDAAARGIRRFEAWSTRPAEPFYVSLGLQRVRNLTLPIPVDGRPGETVPFPSVLMRGALHPRNEPPGHGSRDRCARIPPSSGSSADGSPPEAHLRLSYARATK